MKAKLTMKLVAGLKRKSKPYEARDSELKGFLVRVQESGSKAFYFGYRFEGKQTRLRVGDPSFMTVEDARDVAKQHAAALARGEDPGALMRAQGGGATLENFINEHFVRGQGKTTLYSVCHYFPEFLKKPLADIKKTDIVCWRDTLEKEGRLKKATINRAMNALGTVFTRAVKRGALKESPLRGVGWLKEADSQKIVRYLSPDERARLLAALAAPETPEWVQIMVRLALSTGMRRGELLKLQWANIDMTTRVLSIVGSSTKTGKQRSIPLNLGAYEMLNEWGTKTGMTGYVFGNPKVENFQYHWYRVCERAKLENFRFHDTRHDFGSSLVMRGVDLYTTSALLGHASIQQTQRYAHLSPGALAAAVAKLDGADGGE